MKNFCLDSGIIQAFLDGELAAAESLRVSNHIADCDACALALGEAEEETAFAFSALEGEFNTLVPTQRLWAKINDSIVEEKKSVSVWQKIRSYIAVSLANPSIAVVAGIFVVFGIFVAVITLNPFAGHSVAGIQSKNNPIQLPKSVDPVLRTGVENTTSTEVTNERENSPKIEQASANTKNRQNDSRKVIVQANYGENTQEHNPKPPVPRPSPTPIVETAAYLPGEESYVKTIASLTQTVNGQKNEVLKPSAQIAFARDLAVVDDAIVNMQAEIRKNPKNEAAKQVLYTSYQNKIDLLNSVAEKNELMASLK